MSDIRVTKTSLQIGSLSFLIYKEREGETGNQLPDILGQ